MNFSTEKTSEKQSKTNNQDITALTKKSKPDIPAQNNQHQVSKANREGQNQVSSKIDHQGKFMIPCNIKGEILSNLYLTFRHITLWGFRI